MLLSLYIKNFILIDETHLKLQQGLCVLTGDSGSGKSLVLEAFDMIMGGRIDGVVAKNPNFPTVLTAEFDLGDESLCDKMANDGRLVDIDIADSDILVIQRIISQDNRSRFMVNGAPSTATQVRALGNNLVEICSQRYQGMVLNSAHHIDILDKYAKIGSQVKNIGRLYFAWQILHKEFEQKQEIMREAAYRLGYINETVRELSEANIKSNEEELLVEEKRNLNDMHQIREVALKALELLDYSNNSATVGIKGAMRILSKLPSTKDDVATTLESISIELADLVDNLASLAGQHDDYQVALEKIDDRIAMLRHLARKYQCHSSDLPELLQQNAEYLHNLELSEELLGKYIEGLKKAELDYMEAAEDLSLIRKKQTGLFEKAVGFELQYLNMQHVEFKVVCEKLESGCGNARGIDKVEFLIRTNRNGEFAPLHKIASGGELSRIILAVKVALGIMNDVPLMIFDEVDVGVGGATASHVGHKLKSIARDGKNMQVIVVTHQPQVAAYADQHWLVCKKIKEDGMFYSMFSELNYDGRVEEISRMLGGKSVANETVLSAKRMIEDASSGCV